jgi:hypothetical protein
MEAKYSQITIGEALAIKIKEYYFNEVPWSPLLAFKIGGIHNQLKKACSRFYPEKDILGVLWVLASYSKADMDEALSLFDGKEATCKENQPNAISAHLMRSMGTEK